MYYRKHDYSIPYTPIRFKLVTDDQLSHFFNTIQQSVDEKNDRNQHVHVTGFLVQNSKASLKTIINCTLLEISNYIS